MPLADRDVAIAAALAAGAVARSRYGASLARVEKDRGDFATAADLEAISHLICRGVIEKRRAAGAHVVGPADATRPVTLLEHGDT